MSLLISQHITRIRFLWTALLVVTITTLILAACGGETTTTPTPTTAPTPTPTTAVTPTSAPSPTSATSSTPTAVAKVQIVMTNGQFAFQPGTLTIKVGTQVVWTNMTQAPHTVTSDTGAFNTPSNLGPNQTFMMTFTKPGTFLYHCAIHPYMKATITVTS